MGVVVFARRCTALTGTGREWAPGEWSGHMRHVRREGMTFRVRGILFGQSGKPRRIISGEAVVPVDPVSRR
ncbi:hypothetical protein SBADM41S_11235 [Streptomyces badius]